MGVSSNRKREATLNTLARRIRAGALQSATGEHGFLGIVKSNGPKLLPITD